MLGSLLLVLGGYVWGVSQAYTFFPYQAMQPPPPPLARTIFTYVPPPWLQGILNTPDTTSTNPALTPFQQLYVDSVMEPYNTMVPPNEASLTFERTTCCSHGQRIPVEDTLFPPNTATWPDEGDLYTVFILDVSIRNNHSAVQTAVANIEGNDLAGGDDFMEYVTALAWRNCYMGQDNHGEECSGTGIIYDPDYVHTNVMYVFKQTTGMITVEDGERNSGCQLNLQSTISNTGTWNFEEVNTFIDKYNLELHAATWYKVPYTPMVGRVLCRYHECYGNTLSAFLAPTFFPGTIITLPGVTDLDICGPQISYSAQSSHPLSVENGQRNPIDWTQLLCANCTATSGTRKVGPGFQGINLAG